MTEKVYAVAHFGTGRGAIAAALALAHLRATTTGKPGANNGLAHAVREIGRDDDEFIPTPSRPHSARAARRA
jgi:hypothetical protein